MFNPRLESLRGVAALMVAVSHCFIVFAVDLDESIWDASLFAVNGVQSAITRLVLAIFNGRAAVAVFFVLSGYVLGLSLDRKSKTVSDLVTFYIKRIFRIYPAYIISLTLIIASIYLFHSYIKFPNTSIWFNWWYTTGFTYRNILDNIFLVETNLNPVAWTLNVELIISFLFPFAFLLSRKVSVLGNLVVLALLTVLGYFYIHNLCAKYGFVFYLGLMLPALIDRVKLNLTDRLTNIIFVLSIFCLLLACSPFSDPFVMRVNRPMMVAGDSDDESTKT